MSPKMRVLRATEIDVDGVSRVIGFCCFLWWKDIDIYACHMSESITWMLRLICR